MSSKNYHFYFFEFSQNISADLEGSKRRIQATAEQAMGGAPVNVVNF